MRTVSVLIVDDHAIVAEGLERLLRSAEWVQIAGCARTLQEARVLCQHETPDVILLDLRLPDSQGTATIEAMRQCCPSAQIVVLTAYEWGLEAEARALGVAAFLRKEVASDTVLHTIAGLFPSTPADTPPPVLSQREAEVARLAAAGLSNPEISRALYISENTVKTHLAHILQKLQLGSRVDLARRWPIGV